MNPSGCEKMMEDQIINVFTTLAGRDFPSGSQTFLADTQNVAGCVDIAIMRRPAVRTSPVSHSKRTHTFRTTVGDHPAARARLGSESFVGLNVNSPVPAGLVAEMVAQHRPTRVQDGLCHRGFDEFGGADIADDDQGVFPRDAGSRLVNVMFARVCDLGVNRPDAPLVPGALLDRQRGFVLPVVPQGRNGRPVAACGECLQAKINADRTVAGRQILGHIAIEYYVPAPARVLCEATRPETLRHLARFPKVETPLEVCDTRSIYLDCTRNKRHPAERAFRPTTSAEAWTFALRIPRCCELSADGLNRIGVQPKHRTTARAKIYQIKCGGPSQLRTGLPSALRLPLSSNAKVPNSIGCHRMTGKVFAARRVFDAKFEPEDHRQELAHFPVRFQHLMHGDD